MIWTKSLCALVLLLGALGCTAPSQAPAHGLRAASAELIEKSQRATQTLADVDAALERRRVLAQHSHADDHDARVEREGSENRVLRARQSHAAAVAAYNAALGLAGDGVLDPTTGKRFEPRATPRAAGDAGAPPFEAPPLQGRINDLAGKLSEGERSELERGLAAYERATTNDIVVLLVARLDGRSIDDVAFGTFNTWKIGKKGIDIGVLIVIAVAERKVRIETGLGVGAVLPDLRANDIIQTMKPHLRKEAYGDAIRTALEGIEQALAGR